MILTSNHKGQALVEFVLILPLILMLIFVIIDFSNIFYQKNHLETVANDIVSLKENNLSNDYIANKYKNEYQISYEKIDNYLTIKLTKKVKLVTPLSSTIMDNPYKIKTERVILNE